MTTFTEKVIIIIRSIPRGKVMTYGQIAGMAENPRSARQVAFILHSMSNKYSLPWHRVINSKGEIAIKHHEGFTQQTMLLKTEGVKVSPEGKVDLARYQV